MADFILIPVTLLLLLGLRQNKNGYYEDYLSLNTSNSLRGIMGLDVVIFHAALNLDKNVLNICQGPDAVKVFFFLSGYGLIKSIMNKKNYMDGFLVKRLPKIIIPFTIICVLFSLFFINVYNNYYDFGPLSVKNVLIAFFTKGYTLAYNTWYIVELIVLYILFYISNKIAKNDVEKTVIFSALFTLVTMFTFSLLTKYLGWLGDYSFSTYAFALGLLWAYKENSLVKFIKKHYNIILIIMLTIGVMVAIYVNSIKTTFGNNLVYCYSNHYLFGPILVIGIVILSFKVKTVNPIWSFLGKISYEIYLIHSLVYCVLRSDLLSITNDFQYVLLTILVSIIAATVLYYLDKLIYKAYLSLISNFKRRTQNNG